MADIDAGKEGPSWRWVAVTAIGILGIGVLTWATVVWSQLDNLNNNIEQMKVTLQSIDGRLSMDKADIDAAKDQLQKLWERSSADHELLTKDDYMLKIDDDWIHAQADANRAIRELHRAH